MQNEGFISNNNSSDNTDFIRTDICGMGTYSSRNYEHVEGTIEDSNDNRIDDNQLNIKTYRFQFTEDLNEELYKFSKIHQYDHRKVFKEAWEIWLEENNEMILREEKRLNQFGYDGDIIDKMFKSARYYYRKKSTEKKPVSERCDYVSVNKKLLSVMDNHIKISLLSEDYKPSEGFDEFCKNNIEILREEVQFLCKNGVTNSEKIKQKIKKTYKNRYFLIVKKYS